jgi:hypothetical protein
MHRPPVMHHRAVRFTLEDPEVCGMETSENGDGFTARLGPLRVDVHPTDRPGIWTVSANGGPARRVADTDQLTDLVLSLCAAYDRSSLASAA